MRSIIPSPNLLLVEGATEKRLVPELMEQRGVTWVRADRSFAVQIVDYNGISNMLAEGELETAIKTSRLEAMGIVFDADGLHEDGPSRWNSVRQRCSAIGVQLPPDPPAAGVIDLNPDGIRFGVWMMPDNSSRGMLETFLLNLVPSPQHPLYEHAVSSVQIAQEIGAPFRSVHKHKATIHSWLAWQDQPGAQLHEAVKFRLLDSRSSSADGFVEWFRRLFRV